MRRTDGTVVTSKLVKSAHISSLRHGVSKSGIGRVRHYIKAISKGNFLPVGISDAIASPEVGRSCPRPIVLHAAIDIVRYFVVYIDVVKLTYSDSFCKKPGFTHVSRHVQSSVVAID